jgi:pSer/pThr/pTyr-binding forkhead associated (FHA) protein
MEAKLVVVRGKASKGHISLNLPTVIGRSREADLTIAHPTVSRKHCELFEKDGLLKVRDLGSLNGTFVRRKQIKESELRPDDEFSIGPLTFRVLYEYDGKSSGKKPAPSADDASGMEDLPDFTLLDDISGEDPLSPMRDLSELETTQDEGPSGKRTNGKSGESGESDVLDFLLDDNPKAKKAGPDKGADDDELDQFFKRLG